MNRLNGQQLVLVSGGLVGSGNWRVCEVGQTGMGDNRSYTGESSPIADELCSALGSLGGSLAELGAARFGAGTAAPTIGAAVGGSIELWCQNGFETTGPAPYVNDHWGHRWMVDDPYKNWR